MLCFPLYAARPWGGWNEVDEKEVLELQQPVPAHGHVGTGVMLPAAALIYVNFHHLKSIKRDKQMEGAIHRDFQQMLAISEKRINQKIYTMTEEVREVFPSPDTDTESEKRRKLDLILSSSPWLAHVFLFDREKGFLFRSQPRQMSDKYCREEHEHLSEMFGGWFGMDGKMLVEGMHKKKLPIYCYPFPVKWDGRDAYMANAFFVLPQLSKDRIVFGGASFDPEYLKQSFFPGMLEELIARKLTEEGGNPLAMVVYPTDYESEPGELLAASAGWKEGKPEVSRNLVDVFRGLTLGIKFQSISADEIGRRWVQESFVILGSSLRATGRRSGADVPQRSKEVALARLKSDFVSTCRMSCARRWR